MIMTTRLPEDIYTYYAQALDLLSTDHPHYEEIRKLLAEQVIDELHDHTYSRTNQ